MFIFQRKYLFLFIGCLCLIPTRAMNFSSGRKRNSKAFSNGVKNIKSHRLLFYKDPPVEEITLEEFEQFAVDRLKFLREVENVNIRFKRDSEEYDSKMEKLMVEFLPTYKSSANIPEKKSFMVRNDKEEMDNKIMTQQKNDRRKDHISHFILRLAFAGTEDLRRWFITQELDLFRYRFKKESNEATNQFLREQNLHFEPISKTEKSDLLQNLKDCMFSKEMDQAESVDFYKVPFTDVLDLVRSRRVYLKAGFAYVPRNELVSIILGVFRAQLSLALTVTARRLPYLEEDTRLLPMLKNLSSAYIGDTFNENKLSNDDKLSLNEIDKASKSSFPICMRYMHEGVRNDHHLKYFGRMQYGLFIKAAGLTLDEALKFWRSEFTKKMDVDKFEKQYAYNIRHIYGKEGKRQDKMAYNCIKIITTNQPGLGDHHGCPFKHSDTDILQRRLLSYNVPKDSIKEIIDLVKRQHFQVACARYFEVMHKLPEGSMNLNHPNEYFTESLKILKGGPTARVNSVQSIKVKTEVKEEPMNSSMSQSIDGTPKKDTSIEDMDFDMDDDIAVI